MALNLGYETCSSKELTAWPCAVCIWIKENNFINFECGVLLNGLLYMKLCEFCHQQKQPIVIN